MVISDLNKRSIFKALASKSQIAVAKEFEFDKFYSSGSGMINAINRIYREVKETPEKFTITPDVLELVEKGMESRRAVKQTQTRIMPMETLAMDERDLVVGAKKKAWVLLNQKLDYLARNKTAFRNESIMNLAKLAGIVFDKSQIVQGEATEHIALRAKIDPNITTEQAIAQLMKFREATSADIDD